MKIEKEDLQKALEAVRPGLAKRELIEQSTSFVFMKNMVVTYNDEISIRHPVKGLNVTGAINASLLYDFITKVKEKEISLEVKDNENGSELLMTAGKARAGIAFYKDVKLPLEEVSYAKDWRPLSEGFMKGLKFVLFSCGEDYLERPILTCVNIHSKGMVSSDNLRITSYEISLPEIDRPILIPQKSVRDLIKYPVKAVNISKGWISFSNEELIFSCRLVEDTYPDLVDALNVKETIPFTFPKDFEEIVQRASVFSAEQRINQVEIQCKHRRLYARAKGDIAWFEEWMETDSDASFTVRINAEFLLEILQRTHDSELSATMYRIKFSKDNWTHMSCLIYNQ